jgi:hypothetical protein
MNKKMVIMYVFFIASSGSLCGCCTSSSTEVEHITPDNKYRIDGKNKLTQDKEESVSFKVSKSRSSQDATVPPRGKGHKREYSRLIETFLLGIGGLDYQDEHGQTALHKAVIGKNVAMIKNLLALRADQNIIDTEGKKAKDYAEKELDIAQLLLGEKLLPQYGRHRPTKKIDMVQEENAADLEDSTEGEPGSEPGEKNNYVEGWDYTRPVNETVVA